MSRVALTSFTSGSIDWMSGDVVSIMLLENARIKACVCLEILERKEKYCVHTWWTIACS